MIQENYLKSQDIPKLFMRGVFKEYAKIQGIFNGRANSCSKCKLN